MRHAGIGHRALVGIGLAALALSVVSACSSTSRQPAAPVVTPASGSPTTPPVPPTSGEPHRERERPEPKAEVRSTGTLSPLSTVTVVSPVSGRVVSVAVDLSTRVTKGQSLAEIDTGHTVVRSPIDGIVVDRRIDVGQSVALGGGSSPAPTLFSIAPSLDVLRIVAPIDDGDLVRIAPGMRASFTVDAFPGRVFRATVQSTETVELPKGHSIILTTDNTSLVLRPGMQVNLSISTAE